MKITLLYFSLVVIALFSCKKETFNHESPQILYPCDCCTQADSIIGQYIGHLIKYDHSNWTLGNQVPGTIILDTIITIDVTRNLSNTDFILDSLQCLYDVPYFFDDPVTVSQSTGNIGQSTFDHQHFRHDNWDDAFKLTLANGYAPVPWNGSGPIYYLTTYYFVGFRQ